MNKQLIASITNGGRVVQVWRRIDGASMIYACWTLTNDGTPIGACFEYEVKAETRDTVREQIEVNPYLFGMTTAAFVRRTWSPKVCAACQSRLVIAICEDAVEVGAEVTAE